MQDDANKDTADFYSKPSFLKNQDALEKAQTVFYLFNSARKNSKIYPVHHPILLKTVKDLLDIMNDWFATEENIVLAIIEDEIYFGSLLLIHESIVYGEFVQNLKKLNADTLVFRRGLDINEIIVFISILNEAPEKIQADGGLHHILKNKNISHIQIQKIGIGNVLPGKKYVSRLEMGKTKKNKFIFIETVDIYKKIFESVRNNSELDIQPLSNQLDLIINGIIEDKDVWLRMVALFNKKDSIYFHPVHVMIISLAMGQELGFEKKNLKMLAHAALLHDIGKTVLSDEILKNDGALSDLQREVLHGHPSAGARLLCEKNQISKMAKITALEHHCRYDSSGYPSILEQKQMHPFSEIVALADLYDSLLIALYFYKKIFKASSVVNFIISKGDVYFHNSMVKTFVNTMGLYPPGSAVKLDSGQIGVVYSKNPQNLLRPQIVTLDAATGKKVYIDLMEIDKKKFSRSIEDELDSVKEKIDVNRYI